MPVTTNKFYMAPYNMLTPARIVLLYLSFGIGWILLSDVAAAWFINDHHRLEQVAIVKGIFFVIATAALLHLLIRHYARQIRSTENTFHQAELEIKKWPITTVRPASPTTTCCWTG